MGENKVSVVKGIGELLAEWKSRLGLGDWEIVVNENVSPYDMQTLGVAGECIWDEVHKAATINICDEKDYGKRVLPFDKEKTLVHELLHIKFCMIEGENETANRLCHQLIEDLAKALVKAKRAER
jgi:hypothetical protein